MSEAPIDPVIARAIAESIDSRLEVDDDRRTLVLSRTFPLPPDAMWQAITEPRALARWSPIVPDRALVRVGPATARENPDDEAVDATVLEVDEGRSVIHRWGREELAWIIVPTDDGSLMELRHTMSDPEGAGQLAAGWRICLGRLAVDGDTIRRERVVGQRALAYGWERLRHEFDQRLA